MLIDDEPFMNSELKNLIPFEKFGFKVVYDTTNPVEALNYLENNHVELIVSDIRLTQFSELELIKKAKQINSFINIIILIRNTDFDYESEVTWLGTNDYLLKPVDLNEAIRLLKLVAMRIEDAKVFNPLSETELEEKLSNTMYSAVVVTQKIENDIASPVDFLPDINIDILIGYNKNMYILGFNTVDVLDECISRFSKDYYVGVSESHLGINKIKMMMRQAKISIFARFIENGKKVFKYRLPDYEKVKKFVNELINRYRNHDKAINEYLALLPELFRDCDMTMEEVTAFWNGISAFFVNVDEINSNFNFYSCDDLFEEFWSITQLCNYISLALVKSDLPLDSYNMNESFKSLLDYVKVNFDKHLQLKQLSEMFYINPTYCCDLFKKYTGKTFHEYITNLRMKKAKDILLNENYSIYEVSEKVGFSDYFYFNKFFKKYYGKTPKVMRDSKC